MPSLYGRGASFQGKPRSLTPRFSAAIAGVTSPGSPRTPSSM